MNEPTKRALSVFLLVFLVRIGAAVVSVYTGQNPYAQADIVGFVATAEEIGAGLRRGEYVIAHSSSTYQRWGTFLAPFWLLPGPSLLYASVANAFVGSLAIYNVYIIARYYHSHYAGVLTIVPLAMYPSYLMAHAVPIREAIVLFGITLVARVLLVPYNQSRLWVVVAVVLGLTVATLHRPSNLPLYVTGIGVGFLVYLYQRNRLGKHHLYPGAGIAILTTFLLRDRIRETIEYLAWLREVRARGRTAYLVEIFPTTLPELIAFSWIGAGYFLFSPFPWMVETVSDFLVSLEGLIALVAVFATPLGIRYVARQNPAGTIGLLVGFLLAVVLYGYGTANVGTAVRHRQMFLWVIFLFAAIGIANSIRVEYTHPEENAQKYD